MTDRLIGCTTALAVLMVAGVSFEQIRSQAASWWRAFWKTGAAVDFAGSTDPRTAELVTESDAEKIFFGNAARVYGFDPVVLGPHVERIGFTR